MVQTNRYNILSVSDVHDTCCMGICTYLNFLTPPPPLLDQLFFNAPPSPQLQPRRSLTASTYYHCTYIYESGRPDHHPGSPTDLGNDVSLPTRSESVKDEEHTSPKNTLVFDVSINIKARERGYPFRPIDHFGTRIYLDIFIVCTPFENQRWLKLTIHVMYVHVHTVLDSREKKQRN